MVQRRAATLSAAALLLIITLFPSCKKDLSPIEPPGEAGPKFSFAVTVKNGNGIPVNGLRVSIYSKTSQPSLKKTAIAVPLSSMTAVPFAIEQTSNVELVIRDLDGSLVSRPVNQPLQAGSYIVQLAFPNGGAGTRIFKAVLTATSGITAGVLFRDSIYMTLWRDDPSTSVVGTTNADGVWQTADSLLFPGILALPPLMRTDVTGPDSIGAFTIPKDIVITLTDTVTHKSQSLVKTLTTGENSFPLIWAVTSPTSDNQIPDGVQNLSTVLRKISPPPAIAWRLRQNYPNPFF